MRILCFAGGGDIGGAKTHIISLGRELAKDNEYLLLSFRRGEFAAEARQNGLRVIETENSWNLLSALNTALKNVDKFKPDIIHCHGAKANMMGVFIKKLRHIPVITTVHSDPQLDYLGSPLKQYTFGFINAIALYNMDYYMAVADKMKSTLIERGFDPQKIFVLYNGLDFANASGQPRQADADSDIVVGIAARLTPIKDIPTLLIAFAQAYRRNPRLRLKIAGIGEDEAKLKEMAKHLKIAQRVDFVGWISDMQGFFSQVDINVLSSLSETFPYSLLEGAHEHCAAIASSVGGIPSMIEHGHHGLLFKPGDVDTFAEYIYQLSVDEKLRHQLSKNLFIRCKQEFSLERMKIDQQKVYDDIIRLRSVKGRYGAVICGAYGRGNAGDEAILKAIVSQMREIDSDMPLTVMSRNKMQTRLNNCTNAIHIFNVSAFIGYLRRSQIFINGGGSLIQDVTSSRSLYYYLFTLVAAKSFGCRVIMYGCGIGPINKSFNRRLAASILNKTTEIITLRDSVSYDVLKQMKVDKPQIYLSADPTIKLAKATDKQVQAAFELENVPVDIPKIGFCLRNWPTFANPQAIAAAADYAYNHYGLAPVFLPIELPKDIGAAQQVTEYMNAPYYACMHQHSVEDLIGMLGSMDLVIGMRLHSLIFATAGGAPVIGISYDIKVGSFINDIGSTACIPLTSLNAQQLCAEIDKILASGGTSVSHALD